MIFPKSEYKILRAIYENPGIRLTELIRKVNVSAGTAKTRLSYLLNMNVIKENIIKGNEKVLLKTFYPRFDTEEGIAVFSLIEAKKRQEFLKKHKSLVGPLKQFVKNAGEEIEIVLIFGSFASYSETKESDLDLFILTKHEIKNHDRELIEKELQRSFVTFNNEISPRTETILNFKKNKNSEIYKTIIKNHVVIKGFADYIKIIK